MQGTQTIVVVGAGQAGGWACKTLRDEGFAGRIVLVSEEAHPPYERPPLSKAVLAGEAPPESTHLFKPEVIAQLRLDVRPSSSLTSIDRSSKRIRLSTGDTVEYDKLLLCVGGRARKLSMAGAEHPNVFTLRTLEDSAAIGSALSHCARVAVIGGGWIGLEVAATARKRGAAVTVLEMASRLCERTVPVEISQYLLELHRRNGVDVRLDVRLGAIEQAADGSLSLQLADGAFVAADMVVVGVGLVANDEIAREAGLACDSGVIVDERCRTSDPDIFAAGDVAVAPNRAAGRRIRLESWQNAQDQGIAAAKAALGLDLVYDPLPYFWSDQFDANVQIYGLPSTSHRAVVRGDAGSSSFLVFYIEAERVNAAVGVNAARDLRFARRLIERAKPVSEAALRDATIPLSKV